ncbi:MAG: hypothetical protein HKN53_11800, partial [Maribacter sp.]|nr:hypothetical protein [Maribacter sp.]
MKPTYPKSAINAVRTSFLAFLLILACSKEGDVEVIAIEVNEVNEEQETPIAPNTSEFTDDFILDES